MSVPMISIIIPVYNAEKYMDGCLKSVTSQTFSDYEVIAVDDGSVDRSLGILRQWSEKDGRVHVFSVENRGVSHARNLGMSYAVGKWIMFLDSDDYLMDGALGSLAACSSDEVQEVCGNYTSRNGKVCYESPISIISSDVMIRTTLDPINYCLPAFYEFQDSSLMSCCGKLYLRDVIEEHQISFTEELRLSEDMLFHIEYLSHIQKAALTNLSVFYYRSHPKSVTKNLKVSHLEDRFLLFDRLNLLEYESEVHQFGTLLLFLCQTEGYINGQQKMDLENRIRDYLQKHRDLLVKTQKKKLSRGKYQNLVYCIVRYMFLKKMYFGGFRFLNLYARLSGGGR